VSIDLAALLRRHKPERRTDALLRRDRTDLPSFNALTVRSGTRLLLETGVSTLEAAGHIAAPVRQARPD
jgi:hypothetical protein